MRVDQEEVLAHLRRSGVGSLAEVRYVLYETKGELTIVRERGPEAPDPELVRIALHDTPPARRSRTTRTRHATRESER